MKRYELLDHTADAKFRSFGRTLDEAFANAVEALTAIACDPAAVAHQRTHSLSVRGNDLKSLLFNFIDEILFVHDTERFIPAAAERVAISKQGDGYVLDATLVGDDARKHPGNLKAATYSEMEIAQLPDGSWMLQAVVDI